MVVLNGSWGEAGTAKFCMNYRVRFEKASVVFENGKVTVYPETGEVYSPELPKTDRMAEEIRMFTRTIRDDSLKNESNPPESARDTVRLVEKLRESAALNGEIIKL